MPKIVAHVTPEREAEIRRRGERVARLVATARAAAGAVPTQTYMSESAARSRAVKLSGGMCETTARRWGTGGWYPVALLRSDQGWLRRHLEERGLTCEEM